MERHQKNKPRTTMATPLFSAFVFSDGQVAEGSVFQRLAGPQESK